MLDACSTPADRERRGRRGSRALARLRSPRADIGGGCGNAKTFRCPYHSWTYYGMGEIVKILHAQDIHACKIAWSGLTSGLARPGRLHRLERSIWQQNNWWLDRMEPSFDD